MRIVSLLPSTTEIAFALGLGDEVVAVTHECDSPPEARRLPVITASALDHAGASSAEIDSAVRSQLRDDLSIYHLDVAMLAGLRPDLILTQALCEVCAVSFFSRPGPRIVASLELLAGLIHPDHFAGWGPADGARPVSLS